MIESVKIEQIVESATNPRKIFRDVEGLAEDLKKHGVLQAVLVRPIKGQRYELVFGARRLRAAKLAKLTTIPAQIRGMSDLEALEAQVIENQQRQDVHPLEEADSYRRLMEDHAHSADEIAALVGKSRGYVYGRMKLCALAKGPREAFLADKLSASTALLIARIPDLELQARATKEITKPLWDGELMNYRTASNYIQEQYMLRLKGVLWSLGDAELVPGAGACKACPKRTGNQAELFEDVRASDLCTDPPCYRRKLDAAWAQMKAAAETSGQTVLTDAQAKKLFQFQHLAHNSGYIDLAAKNHDDAKLRTWGALIRKQKPPIAIARDEDGRVYELVRRADATKALRDGGHRAVAARSKPTRKAAPSTSDRKFRRKTAIDLEVEHQVAEAVVGRAERSDFTVAAWRILAAAALRSVWEDSRRQVSRRRGLKKPVKKGFIAASHEDVLLAEIASNREKGALRGLTLELLVQDLDSKPGAGRLTADAVAKAFGVDVGRLRRRVTADVDCYLKALEAKKKGPKARKKRAPKKPAASKATRKKATRRTRAS